MDTWTRQMGFPLIIVSREGSTITARQKRFILTVNMKNETEHMNESISPFGYKWYVPLSYYTNQHTGKVHHIWMNMSDGKIVSKIDLFFSVTFGIMYETHKLNTGIFQNMQ